MPANLSGLTAVVLAGGKGSRLRDVAGNTPKVLVEVAGRPFLAYNLDKLQGLGVERVVLCTGFGAEEVRRVFPSDHRGMTLHHSPEPAPLGTAGALRHALPMLSAGPVLVLNGDSFSEADFGAFHRSHCARGAEGSVLLSRVDNASAFGTVTTDSEGRIEAFQEKRPLAEPGLVNAGVYLLAKDWIESIPTQRAVSIEEEMFPGWVSRPFYGFESGSGFLDIGTPERLEVAERHFDSRPATCEGGTDHGH